MKRRAIVVTACVAGAALFVTGGILVSTGRGGGETKADITTQTVSTGTARVEKGDLVGTTTKPGTVQRIGGSLIPAGPRGTLTEVPRIGTVIKPGDVVYRVDNVPVSYLAGVLPQWRPFIDGMSDGPDIKQLEDNLRAWGYLDEVATEHFDWHTRVAIEKWQKTTEQPITGSISAGTIVFGMGDQVVSERKLEPGAPVEPGAELLVTTGTEMVVVVDLPVGSPLARVGGKVKVDLPGSPQAKGTISSLGDPVTPEDGGESTVPVTVKLADPGKARELDQVSVSVVFVSETRKNVLSVPVSALAARAGSGFLVEVEGKAGVSTKVPVDVGLFAGDRVEITVGRLQAGQRVVVPA